MVKKIEQVDQYNTKFSYIGSLSDQTNFTYRHWKESYEKLRNEKKSFRNYFDKHRKCRCKIESCKHLKNTEKELEFKHKSWELHIQYMNMSLGKLMENAPELFEKRKKLKKSISK